MTITTLSSRELNQNVSLAKKATNKGPVFITDRGKPAHVLLSYEEYLNLTAAKQNIVEMLQMDKGDEIEFEPEKLSIALQPVDFF